VAGSGSGVTQLGVDALAEALKRLVPKEFAERLLATRGQVGGERRTVTMLFSDVKGSTALADKLDPEDVLEVMNGAFEFLIGPIYRYEGTLARLMGDAILAFFGAPIAHEDDPERACRAGLEIIAGAKEYAAKLERERGISGFAVRVGINTGLVVVGEVGSDLRVEYTALGDAINLAARMEQAAEPGTILVSEETHGLIAPLFEMDSLGRIEVKGRTEPVRVYRVLEAKAAGGKVRGIAGLESPLVGRDGELGALQEALGRLQAGLGGIVAVIGEAGLGKSRLVAEVRKSADLSRLRWVEGCGLSYGTSIAYLLWLDVLRHLLGVTEEAPPAGVRERLREQVRSLCPERYDDLYPYLGRLMSLPLEADVEAKLGGSGGPELKAKTFAAMELLLECAASQRPLVLVCEDLHWADSASVELLERLFAVTDRAPVLFVCAMRPERDRPSWRIGETGRRTHPHRYVELSLAPLSTEESRILVGNLLPVEGLPDALRNRILEQAEGNPFYLEEILRSLISTGALARDEATGRWLARRDVAEIALPDTLQGVLMARIDRLQEDTKRVLQMASVIGRAFLYRVLAAVAEEEERLDRHLVTLQREEMIRERARIPEQEYIFKHYLTQEAAYDGLLKRDRRAYHRQVAVALERLFPERRDELCGLLAYQWERAEVAEKAIEYLLKAGDQARLLYAHQEAIGFYERALALLRRQDDAERAARTLMKLGLTYHTAFDYERSRAAYDEAFALRRQAEEARTAAEPTALQTLRLGGLEPPTLDPSIANDTTSGRMIALLFSTLVALSPDMDVLPDVAHGWDVSADGRRYVFHLRDDVVWSDGVPVTAGDFQYAWSRVLDPAMGSQNAYLFYDVKGARAFHQGEQRDARQIGVRAADDRTLVVELDEPTGYFLQLLCNGATCPLPRHVVDRFANAWTEVDKIVTNGPFRLESWERGRSMTFVRNPQYHGSFEGNVGRVRLALVGMHEGSQQLAAMREASDLDVLSLSELGSSVAEGVLQRFTSLRVVRAPAQRVYILVFDVTRPPFDDPRVRRAFVLGTDRGALADAGPVVGLLPATGGLTPPGVPGHCAGTALPYDPEGARQLLAVAGYPQGRGFPAIGFMALSLTSAGLLQGQWRQNLGLEIPCVTMEWGEYIKRVTSDPPHVYEVGWLADYPDPDTFLRVFPAVFGKWRNESYEELVQKARRVLDQGERMRLYRQAEGILAAESPVMVLGYRETVVLAQPWVKRFPMCAAAAFFLTDVVIDPH
jgi:ABC-type oligopeptide transport system substrate-binding subunit/class 3 adenylate cyclase